MGLGKTSSELNRTTFIPAIFFLVIGVRFLSWEFLDFEDDINTWKDARRRPKTPEDVQSLPKIAQSCSHSRFSIRRENLPRNCENEVFNP